MQVELDKVKWGAGVSGWLENLLSLSVLTCPEHCTGIIIIIISANHDSSAHLLTLANLWHFDVKHKGLG